MSALAEAGLMVAILAAFAVICGATGGAIGYIVSRAAYERIQRFVEVEVDVQTVTARIVAPVQVDLQVNVPNMAPISVPVEAELVNSTPNVELTRRLLDEAPQLGPRALARIFQCAPSTAQTYYVQSAKVVGTSVTPEQALNLAVTEVQP
jgi:hypothetical protein